MIEPYDAAVDSALERGENVEERLAHLTKHRAEIMINGPKGQSFATVEVRNDGIIEPAYAEAALACALNYYNELP